MNNTNPSTSRDSLQRARKRTMAVLAQSEAIELSRGLAAIGPIPQSEEIRKAECGLVMIRGRIGGDGAVFNLGEATVARAAVQLASGEIGFGYVLGRDQDKARLIAFCDALMQNDEYRDAIEREVVKPIRTRLAARRKAVDEQTAATRVDFFTLVRGEG